MLGSVMGGRARAAGPGSLFTTSKTSQHKTSRRFWILPVLILRGKW